MVGNLGRTRDYVSSIFHLLTSHLQEDAIDKLLVKVAQEIGLCTSANLKKSDEEQTLGNIVMIAQNSLPN